MLYVSVNYFVGRGCAVAMRYIHLCNSDVFSVVNMYLDHLKFYVVCINGRTYVGNVMLSLMSVVTLPPVLCNLSVRAVVK